MGTCYVFVYRALRVMSEAKNLGGGRLLFSVSALRTPIL